MAENPTPNGAGPEKRAEALKRRCTGTTRQGQPCKAAPLKDRDVCMAHSDAETRASVGFVPEAGRLGGRPRLPRAVDIWRERLEREQEEWWKVLTDARSAQRGVVVGDGDSARLEFFDDHPTRIKAFREATDRVIGRPLQTHDITTRVEESEVDREISELLGQMDSADPDLAEVAQANGKGH